MIRRGLSKGLLSHIMSADNSIGARMNTMQWAGLLRKQPLMEVATSSHIVDLRLRQRTHLEASVQKLAILTACWLPVLTMLAQALLTNMMRMESA